ncbi:hypothetical protein [Hymenobacter sp. GOD-10R]|nr:hypothetical protein [Hymenobacter sp. GOD-10R]WRQ29250.1 hypothetical protein SD425_03100 [Hymenobacter sp. GOD-10R]
MRIRIRMTAGLESKAQEQSVAEARAYRFIGEPGHTLAAAADDG